MIFSHFIGLYHDQAILCRRYPMKKIQYNLLFLLFDSLSVLQEMEFGCLPASNNVQQTFLLYASDVLHLLCHLDWSVQSYCEYIHSCMTCLQNDPAIFGAGRPLRISLVMLMNSFLNRI